MDIIHYILIAIILFLLIMIVVILFFNFSVVDASSLENITIPIKIIT